VNWSRPRGMRRLCALRQLARSLLRADRAEFFPLDGVDMRNSSSPNRVGTILPPQNRSPFPSCSHAVIFLLQVAVDFQKKKKLLLKAWKDVRTISIVQSAFAIPRPPKYLHFGQSLSRYFFWRRRWGLERPRFSIKLWHVQSIPNNKVRKVSVVNHFFRTNLPFHQKTYNLRTTG
jgi:hypothetical protein